MPSIYARLRTDSRPVRAVRHRQCPVLGADRDYAMSDVTIPAIEIADLLRKVLRGEVPIKVIGCSWGAAYAGDVLFEIDGYLLTIFNDCEELDYVSEATAPDGRNCDFDAWYDDGGDPICFLTEIEVAGLEAIFKGIEP